MFKVANCIICTQQLLLGMFQVCKDCQELQISTSHLFKKQKQEGSCRICTFENSIDAIQCSMCGQLFEQRLSIPSKVKKVTSLINCKQCHFQNDLSYEYCLNCEEQLFEHIKKKCQICEFLVREDNYPTHYEGCLLSKSLIQEQQEINKIKDLQVQVKPEKIQSLELIKEHFMQKPKPVQKQKPAQKLFKKLEAIVPIIEGKGKVIKQNQIKSTCYYCQQKIQKGEVLHHLKTCQKKIIWKKNIESAYSRMTPLQAKSILYMHNKSAKQHQSVRLSLQDRVNKLGFTSEDLDNLQFYIENYAPIIIQIHVSKHMQFFVKDTHYRNQFETNKSSGSLSRASRTKWEDRMFDNTYSKATDFQRVKYGVINFTNDPKGVQCAKSYGPSYFLLKSHIRDRCTFTDKDSSSVDANIATLKFGFKIVSKMNDNELKAAFKASKALQESSGVLVTYKQLQIHGPIQFDKDIERIYVNKQQIKGQKQLLDMVYEFSKKFNVQHDFI